MLLSLVAIIPFSAILNKNTIKPLQTWTANNKIQSHSNSSTLDESEIEYIICDAMTYIDSKTSTEAKKAFLAISKNNYIYRKENNITTEDLNISKYSDELLMELTELINETNISLTHNGDVKFIPISEITPGYTISDEKYPYLPAVASPWDTFSPQYNSNQDFLCGISAYGIKYLCQKGERCTAALRWYLPYFKITA